MAKIDSAPQGKKVLEQKSEKDAAPHAVPPRTNNGETAKATESQGKKKVCPCCSPREFRDDTAVAVSRYDRDYLDLLVKDRENLTGRTQTVKDELHHIINAYRAISGPGVKA